MKKKSMGALVATLAAGMILSGQVIAEEKAPAPANVKCSGGNACKGKSDCHSADNACKGMNGCKGKGWVMVGSEKECADKGGKVVKE